MANPGCYPTGALLALRPLADANLLAPNVDVIVDAKSGVSGAEYYEKEIMGKGVHQFRSKRAAAKRP